MRALSPFIALIVLVIAGALINPDFLTASNLLNVVTRSAFIAIIAVGATFVIAGGGLDLSVGSMAALVAGVMILTLNGSAARTWARWRSACWRRIALGAACGLANGLIVTFGRIEPFIVTLGTMGIFRSLVIWLAAGGTITMRNFELRETLSPGLFRQRLRHPDPDHRLSRGRRHRRADPLQDVLRPPCGGARLERGCGALFGRADLARAHAHLHHPGDLRRHRRAGLCAAPRFGDADHGPAVGIAGDHRRRHRRHGAARRHRPHLGHRRRRR